MSDEEKDHEFIPNPPELDGVPDLSMLVYLEMEHVLHNLEFRYRKMARKHCYTSVSTVLVAINPYERLPIYGQDVIDEFHSAASQGRLPQGRPHPYGVSARSYMRLIQRKTNQSIVVCGESGAGKTETTKLLMRYLALTAPSTSMESSMVEQQIIAASPILEAYGNAKTVLNNNSSRFGKFTKLLYDVPEQAREGTILGSYLETYLLEKSRVVKQAQNERNYHIFYFLFHGLDDAQKDQMQLIHPDNYYYTNQGNCAEVPGVNDVERYQELYESMGLMRIDEELQRDLWRMTIGILHLGNIEFVRQGDGFAEISPKSAGIVDCVAGLWGVTPNALGKRLTTANMTVNKKKIEKKLTFDDASVSRDSISKALYENIFNWLCSRINAELYQIENEEDLTNLLFIGILDVFGFENFVNNSLEQFCINFTNEKLQQFFNFHIIRSEQEEYIKESVFWTPLSVPDNLALIEMIEDKKWGFFTLLDSACSAPQPSVEAWMDELFKRHGDNPTLKRATAPGSGGKGGKKKKKKKRGGGAKFDGFELHHFADEVVYNAEMFLTKNMEAIHPDTAKMLKKSESPLVQQIGGGGGGKKKKKKKSVTGVFFKALSTLMKNLMATEPFFVRCVNPNKNKSSKLWHVDIVEHQLRCGGLVEALKVLKLGYPTRVPYSVLYEKYHSQSTNPLIQNMNAESFSTAILIAFDVSEEDYELGLTKIFFKPAKAAVLDTIMAQAGTPLSAEQNEKITKWVVKKRIRQAMGVSKTFIRLRMQVRMTRAAKTWEHVGRVGSILATALRRNLLKAREVILERKRNEGAQHLQTFWRFANAHKSTQEKLAETRAAVAMIWESYRRWDERANLQQWLDVKVEETRKRKEEEERQRLEEEQRRILEEKRKEEERLKNMAEEERRKEEQRMMEERRRAQEEAERIKLEADKKAAEEAQRKAAEEEAARRKEEEEKKAEEERLAREAALEEAARERKKEEKVIRETKKIKKAKKEEEHMRRQMPEIEDDDDDFSVRAESDDDDDYESESEDEERAMPSLKEQLKKFPNLARTGQLFLKYTGKRRRKPQDRIVKVSFDSSGPKQISWGSGSRHIDFSEIRFIAWGHKTPVFEARKDQLDPDLCFSVVGRTQILDVSATSRQTAELWVKGLRRMLKQSDEDADRLAEEAHEQGTLPGAPSRRGTTTGGGPANSPGPNEERESVREHKKRTKSLMLLQQDLFVMTTTTVLRTLEEERIWVIDQEVRDRFNAKLMYEQALRSDIPWRRWNTWIREQIVTYLRETGKVIHPQDNFTPASHSRGSMSRGGGSISSLSSLSRGAGASMSRNTSFRGSQMGAGGMGMNRPSASSRVAFVSRASQSGGRSAMGGSMGGGSFSQTSGGFGGGANGNFIGQVPQRGGGSIGGPGGGQGNEKDDQCIMM